MPYLECPGCRLSLYSAAAHSWIADDCPVCGASLLDAPKRFPATPGAWTVCREFPSTPRAVGSARHALDPLYGELGDDLHGQATLLISELVSNSVKHSGAANGVIELFVCVTPRAIRVEVSDDGEGFEPPPMVHSEADSGLGLQLVQEIADRWDWTSGVRTSVWFEIDRPAAGEQDSSAAPVAWPAPVELQVAP
jgi:anti-sigma regulatory factor (Ser/Thr protein kinase)